MTENACGRFSEIPASSERLLAVRKNRYYSYLFVRNFMKLPFREIELFDEIL